MAHHHRAKYPVGFRQDFLQSFFDVMLLIRQSYHADHSEGARALVDRGIADELRDACMAVALELGGWDRRAKSKNGKSKRPEMARAAAS